jgi:hypothetical protein
MVSLVMVFQVRWQFSPDSGISGWPESTSSTQFQAVIWNFNSNSTPAGIGAIIRIPEQRDSMLFHLQVFSRVFLIRAAGKFHTK